LYEAEFEEAVRDYWRVRAGQRRKQEERGTVDVGDRAEVTAGKQLESLTKLVAQVFLDAGLPEDSIKFQGRLSLPGYYRPTKEWDLLVVCEDELVAAVELKSIASSFGNNMNNRIEEAVGSAKDILTAYREGAFGTNKPWLGYLFMIADDDKSRNPTKVSEPLFPVDEQFRGASYQRRAELFCRRLVLEQLYDASSFVVSSRDPQGPVTEPSSELSFANFAASIRGHVHYVLKR
jgi:hypothetical protein